MRVVFKAVVLASIVSLLVASVALAKTKEQSAQVSIAFTTKLADGTQLQPGSYRVTLVSEAGSQQIVFYKGAKLVCKCPVKLEDVGKKIRTTQISYAAGADNTHSITSMEIGGWTQRVLLSGSGT